MHISGQFWRVWAVAMNVYCLFSEITAGYEWSRDRLHHDCGGTISWFLPSSSSSGPGPVTVWCSHPTGLSSSRSSLLSPHPAVVGWDLTKYGAAQKLINQDSTAFVDSSFPSCWLVSVLVLTLLCWIRNGMLDAAEVSLWTADIGWTRHQLASSCNIYG